MSTLATLTLASQAPSLPSGAEKTGAPQAEANEAQKVPLLGIFTTRLDEETMLYSTDQNLQLTHGLIYVSENRHSGKVLDIQACPKAVLLKKIKAGKVVPGEFLDSHGGRTSFAFEGKIDPKVCSGGLSGIGMLFRPGSVILGSDKNVAGFKFVDDKYIIEHHFTTEGYSVACIVKTTHKIVAKFYYYLGYDLTE